MHNINIEKRRIFSENRLSEIRKFLEKFPPLSEYEDGLCVYVTGSYGRQEASENSDIDVFFLLNNRDLIYKDRIIISAKVIEICNNYDLEVFSDEGEYANIHHLEKLVDEIGSQNDDYGNFFTARLLLLLLESSYLYNNELHNKSIRDIVDRYYTDYHDHVKEFRPVFLSNDIIRFWKTLCLNYEHKRNRRGKDEKSKNRSHIKNIKLKFSRLMTCYSLLCRLGGKQKIDQDILLKFVAEKPIIRMQAIGDENKSAKDTINRILELYDWFLGVTDIPEDKLIEWIGNKVNRDRAFDKARDYHDFFI